MNDVYEEKRPLSKAVEAVDEPLTTGDCIADMKAGKRTSGLARDGVSTTFGDIYDSNIQDLIHLYWGTRDVLTRDVTKIGREAVMEQSYIPITSDM